MALFRTLTESKRGWLPFVRTSTTKALAEIANAATIAAVSTVAPGGPLPPLAGMISKQVVEALLARTAEIERKIDKLMREPLLTGLQLLKDAATNENATAAQVDSRDALLDAAHNCFVRALALTADSREDSLFIRGLDCIVLAERTGRANVAASHLQELQLELQDFQQRVCALQAEANDWTDHVQALNRFLHRDPSSPPNYRDVPHGYAEQVGLAKSRVKQAERVKGEAEGARLRFKILQDIAAIAAVSLQRAQAVPTGRP